MEGTARSGWQLVWNLKVAHVLEPLVALVQVPWSGTLNRQNKIQNRQLVFSPNKKVNDEDKQMPGATRGLARAALNSRS